MRQGPYGPGRVPGTAGPEGRPGDGRVRSRMSGPAAVRAPAGDGRQAPRALPDHVVGQDHAMEAVPRIQRVGLVPRIQSEGQVPPTRTPGLAPRMQPRATPTLGTSRPLLAGAGAPRVGIRPTAVTPGRPRGCRGGKTSPDHEGPGATERGGIARMRLMGGTALRPRRRLPTHAARRRLTRPRHRGDRTSRTSTTDRAGRPGQALLGATSGAQRASCPVGAISGARALST